MENVLEDLGVLSLTFNLFHVNISLLYLLKMSETKDVLKGYKSGTMA